MSCNIPICIVHVLSIEVFYLNIKQASLYASMLVSYNVFLHSLLILLFSIGTSFDFPHLMWCILDIIQMRLMVERCQSEKIILHPKLIYANARNCGVTTNYIFEPILKAID